MTILELRAQQERVRRAMQVLRDERAALERMVDEAKSVPAVDPPVGSTGKPYTRVAEL